MVFVQVLPTGYPTKYIKPPQKESLPCKTIVLQSEGHSFQQKPKIGGIFIVAFALTIILPASASASVFSGILGSASASAADQSAVASSTNSQNMPLAIASIGPDMMGDGSQSSSDIIINDAALTPGIGPVGNESAVNDTEDNSGQISVYTVHKGDTIASVAKMFGVSPATIMWANDLATGSKLKDGTILTIPAVSGRLISVKKGDTFQSLAKKYGVEASVIAFSNDMTLDDQISVGDTLVVPDENLATPKGLTTAPKSSPKTAPRSNARPSAGTYFIYPLPVSVSHWVRGLHGNCGCGVDLGAPKGTPIYAVADGTVIIAKSGGYNAGWGSHVVINHILPNGLHAQTLSAHMSAVAAHVGDVVHQGDVIGYVGSTGLSTGPHLHIEVSGVSNPFVDPKYGR